MRAIRPEMVIEQVAELLGRLPHTVAAKLRKGS